MNAARERPSCRLYILRLGLRPHIEPDGKWRKRAVNEQGEVSHLSDGLRKQMRLMLEQGHWEAQPQSEIETNKGGNYATTNRS